MQACAVYAKNTSRTRVGRVTEGSAVAKIATHASSVAPTNAHEHKGTIGESNLWDQKRQTTGAGHCTRWARPAVIRGKE